MKDKEILRRTSRSFFLTVRLLPRAVRNEIGLAYLLARASDTIADTSTAPPGARVSLLRSLRASLGSGDIAGYAPDDWVRHQRDPAEQALLRTLPRLWQRMPQCATPTRDLLRTVLDRILEGQIFDLERFGPSSDPLGDDELERYTYLVAGSVGEFWHDLSRARLPGFSAADPSAMRERARRYGQALQLVNILRDRRMDGALGRVYVPPDRVAYWTDRARAWLDHGADYCAALSSGRMRYATLLPAVLGFRTLALTAVQPEGMLTPVKVPRAELRRWMRRALPVWCSPAAVSRLVREASE